MESTVSCLSSNYIRGSHDGRVFNKNARPGVISNDFSKKQCIGITPEAAKQPSDEPHILPRTRTTEQKRALAKVGYGKGTSTAGVIDGRRVEVRGGTEEVKGG
eukprot:CAMPEP_0175047918 /NCGR_PEP_ID=MMETSP0052_2-20121109/5878_1 /TAXON_ID=51329 ORGANISM="Polytomella parva, Strain SAG 63-3" /NCGR_SAMPLE_ID=MMETSP0052_2 /ASSEMBLY_ACC=CAM_ASM_000194 /LENGTH=102 /DNA_ID=CAMNT_0016311879 /DNA_START=297 /DNA_END=601 /DNA_ORIENTATION=+